MRTLTLMISAVLLSLVVAGCTGVQPAIPTEGDLDATATEIPGEAEDEQSMAGMDHGAMEMEGDIPFDAQFIDSMIEHHQGAIDMAEEVLDKSDQADLRGLAEAIILAQTGEIEEMQTWREAWFPDLPPTEGMAMEMGDMEVADDPAQPYEQRFLNAMISHHRGAVAMAEMALERSEREEIRTLAEAIIAAQEGEILLMQGWLDEWYGD